MATIFLTMVSSPVSSLILKKSVELNPAENIQHKLDKPTGAMIFV